MLRKLLKSFFIITVLVCLSLCVSDCNKVKAASKHNIAGEGNLTPSQIYAKYGNKGVLDTDGNICFVNMGKQASSTSSIKYRSIGLRIQLNVAGKELKRDFIIENWGDKASTYTYNYGNTSITWIKEVCSEVKTVNDVSYVYSLKCIKRSKVLEAYAEAKDENNNPLVSPRDLYTDNGSLDENWTVSNIMTIIDSKTETPGCGIIRCDEGTNYLLKAVTNGGVAVNDTSDPGRNRRNSIYYAESDADSNRLKSIISSFNPASFRNINFTLKKTLPTVSVDASISGGNAYYRDPNTAASNQNRNNIYLGPDGSVSFNVVNKLNHSKQVYEKKSIFSNMNYLVATYNNDDYYYTVSANRPENKSDTVNKKYNYKYKSNTVSNAWGKTPLAGKVDIECNSDDEDVRNYDTIFTLTNNRMSDGEYTTVYNAWGSLFYAGNVPGWDGSSWASAPVGQFKSYLNDNDDNFISDDYKNFGYGETGVNIYSDLSGPTIGYSYSGGFPRMGDDYPVDVVIRFADNLSGIKKIKVTDTVNNEVCEDRDISEYKKEDVSNLRLVSTSYVIECWDNVDNYSAYSLHIPNPPKAYNSIELRNYYEDEAGVKWNANIAVGSSQGESQSKYIQSMVMAAGYENKSEEYFDSENILLGYSGYNEGMFKENADKFKIDYPYMLYDSVNTFNEQLQIRTLSANPYETIKNAWKHYGGKGNPPDGRYKLEYTCQAKNTPISYMAKLDSYMDFNGPLLVQSGPVSGPFSKNIEHAYYTWHNKPFTKNSMVSLQDKYTGIDYLSTALYKLTEEDGVKDKLVSFERVAPPSTPTSIASYGYTVHDNMLDQGMNYYLITSKDRYGNKSEYPLYYNYDSVKPRLNVSLNKGSLIEESENNYIWCVNVSDGKIPAGLKVIAHDLTSGFTNYNSVEYSVDGTKIDLDSYVQNNKLSGRMETDAAGDRVLMYEEYCDMFEGVEFTGGEDPTDPVYLTITAKDRAGNVNTINIKLFNDNKAPDLFMGISRLFRTTSSSTIAQNSDHYSRSFKNNMVNKITWYERDGRYNITETSDRTTNRIWSENSDGTGTKNEYWAKNTLDSDGDFSKHGWEGIFAASDNFDITECYVKCKRNGNVIDLFDAGKHNFNMNTLAGGEEYIKVGLDKLYCPAPETRSNPERDYRALALARTIAPGSSYSYGALISELLGTLTEGSFPCVLYAKDAAGNVAEYDFYIKLDHTAPTCTKTADTGTGGQNGYNNTGGEKTFNIVDTVSGIKKVYLRSKDFNTVISKDIKYSYYGWGYGSYAGNELPNSRKYDDLRIYSNHGLNVKISNIDNYDYLYMQDYAGNEYWYPLRSSDTDKYKPVVNIEYKYGTPQNDYSDSEKRAIVSYPWNTLSHAANADRVDFTFFDNKTTDSTSNSVSGLAWCKVGVDWSDTSPDTYSTKPDENGKEGASVWEYYMNNSVSKFIGEESAGNINNDSNKAYFIDDHTISVDTSMLDNIIDASDSEKYGQTPVIITLYAEAEDVAGNYMSTTTTPIIISRKGTNVNAVYTGGHTASDGTVWNPDKVTIQAESEYVSVTDFEMSSSGINLHDDYNSDDTSFTEDYMDNTYAVIYNKMLSCSNFKDIANKRLRSATFGLSDLYSSIDSVLSDNSKTDDEKDEAQLNRSIHVFASDGIGKKSSDNAIDLERRDVNSVTEDVKVNIDKTEPDCIDPATGITAIKHNSSEFTINVDNVFDSISGVDINECRVTLVDSSGNVLTASDNTPYTFKVDKKSESLRNNGEGLSEEEKQKMKNQMVNFSSKINCPVTGSAKKARITVKDNAGNIKTFADIPFNVDKLSPVCEIDYKYGEENSGFGGRARKIINSATNVYANPDRIDFTFTDDQTVNDESTLVSGLKRCSVKVDWNNTLPANSDAVWSLYNSNGFNDSQTVTANNKSETIKIDTSMIDRITDGKPVKIVLDVSAEDNAGNVYNDSVTVYFSRKDCEISASYSGGITDETGTIWNPDSMTIAGKSNYITITDFEVNSTNFTLGNVLDGNGTVFSRTDNQISFHGWDCTDVLANASRQVKIDLSSTISAIADINDLAEREKAEDAAGVTVNVADGIADMSGNGTSVDERININKGSSYYTIHVDKTAPDHSGGESDLQAEKISGGTLVVSINNVYDRKSGININDATCCKVRFLDVNKNEITKDGVPVERNLPVISTGLKDGGIDMTEQEKTWNVNQRTKFGKDFSRDELTDMPGAKYVRFFIKDRAGNVLSVDKDIDFKAPEITAYITKRYEPLDEEDKVTFTKGEMGYLHFSVKDYEDSMDRIEFVFPENIDVSYYSDSDDGERMSFSFDLPENGLDYSTDDAGNTPHPFYVPLDLLNTGTGNKGEYTAMQDYNVIVIGYKGNDIVFRNDPDGPHINGNTLINDVGMEDQVIDALKELKFKIRPFSLRKCVAPLPLNKFEIDYFNFTYVSDVIKWVNSRRREKVSKLYVLGE